MTIGVWAISPASMRPTARTSGEDKSPWTPRFHAATSPLIVDGMVVARLGGPGNGADGVDLATGDQKWKWDAEGPGYASPVVATIDGVEQIVTMTEKSVVGVAAADGKLLWKVALRRRGWPTTPATPVVDGQTVIFTGQGRGTKAVKIERPATPLP